MGAIVLLFTMVLMMVIKMNTIVKSLIFVSSISISATRECSTIPFTMCVLDGQSVLRDHNKCLLLCAHNASIITFPPKKKSHDAQHKILRSLISRAFFSGYLFCALALSALFTMRVVFFMVRNIVCPITLRPLQIN